MESQYRYRYLAGSVGAASLGGKYREVVSTSWLGPGEGKLLPTSAKGCS
jgi:hypothetical protein